VNWDTVAVFIAALRGLQTLNFYTLLFRVHFKHVLVYKDSLNKFGKKCFRKKTAYRAFKAGALFF